MRRTVNSLYHTLVQIQPPQPLRKELTMNSNFETICALAQGIIDATIDMPEQYAEKIEELAATIVTVAAMAEGVPTAKTINSSDLVEGRNELSDGIVAYREGNEIRLARE